MQSLALPLGHAASVALHAAPGGAGGAIHVLRGRGAETRSPMLEYALRPGSVKAVRRRRCERLPLDSWAAGSGEVGCGARVPTGDEVPWPSDAGSTSSRGAARRRTTVASPAGARTRSCARAAWPIPAASAFSGRGGAPRLRRGSFQGSEGSRARRGYLRERASRGRPRSPQAWPSPTTDRWANRRRDPRARVWPTRIQRLDSRPTSYGRPTVASPTSEPGRVCPCSARSRCRWPA